MTRLQTPQNRLLSALPPDEFDRLVPLLENFKLIQGEVLYNSGADIHHVFFPNSGICGLLSATESGSLTEVAMVGSEGMLGIPIVLGFNISPHEAVVQAGGSAMRMSVGALRQEFECHGRFCDLLLRHAF